MNINIQTVHFDADEKLLDFVAKKIQKLATFHDRITKVDVFLKLDNLVHSIKDKVVEIKIHIPKQDCFVKASAKSFEASSKAGANDLQGLHHSAQKSTKISLSELFIIS